MKIRINPQDPAKGQKSWAYGIGVLITHMRPAMMYGAETRVIKKTEEIKLDVAERRMLRWICEVTRRDKIRNEVIRGTTKVRQLSHKIQGSRLRCYSHIMRKDQQYVGRGVIEMDVQGKRRRGRPKPRWVDCIKDDLRSKGDEACVRNKWRTLATNIDPL